MRHVLSKRAALRCLDERRVQRVPLGGQWIAFRCPDARRMQIALGPDALAAGLAADGRATRTLDEPLGLVAGPWR